MMEDLKRFNMNFPLDPVYSVFDEDQDYFDGLVEEDPHQLEQHEKYTALLWELANDMKPFECEDRCKAPDGFFLGAPWMKTSNVTGREGNKVELICQIWNGIVTDRSSLPSANVFITLNGPPIYSKVTIGVNSTAPPGWNRVDVREEVSPGSGHFSDFAGLPSYTRLVESVEPTIGGCVITLIWINLSLT